MIRVRERLFAAPHFGRLLVRQRTMLSNAIRGHMAELGIISAKGRNGNRQRWRQLHSPTSSCEGAVHT
jgi:transposase